MPSRRDVLLWSAAAVVAGRPASAADTPADLTRVFAPGARPPDPRLGAAATLNGYFPFAPPISAAEWAARKLLIREHLQVSLGLWPYPERAPLNAVVHGAIARDGYTVEKVFFASTPGHTVSGNLYRPTGAAKAPRPAVLCPHGHWANGRFYAATDAEVTKQLKLGAEATPEAARYPLQARMANLAMQGFVVFHFDMIGYADSTAIPHKAGFHPTPAAAVRSELRSLNAMGLQTWNSIRALDFLETLADVDPKRIGVTGASGGGTQTFILCALDDRPAAAFPAVMVSTAMQGGCTCENASYLRIGTGNVEFAAAFAPKPIALTGADDWTKEILTKGFPQVRELYAVLGKPDRVAAKAWPEFPHNFNRPAREFLYSWFAEHLRDQPGPVAEKPFVPVPPADLSVFDEAHPRPAGELDSAKLGDRLWAAWQDRWAKLLPRDPAGLAEYRRIVGTALRVMTGGPADALRLQAPNITKTAGGIEVQRALVGRKGAKDAVPLIGVLGPKFDGRVVVWLDPAGKSSVFAGGEPVPAAKALLAAGAGILAPDLYGTGEATPETPRKVDPAFPAYALGYNRPAFAERVRDALTAIAFGHRFPHTKTVHVVGWGACGPVAVLARAAAGDSVAKTAAAVGGFRFEAVTDAADPAFLPGAEKFGGLGGFLGLCAPGPVLVHDHAGTGIGKAAKACYAAAGVPDRLTMEKGPLPPEKVAAWLLS